MLISSTPGKTERESPIGKWPKVKWDKSFGSEDYYLGTPGHQLLSLAIYSS